MLCPEVKNRQFGGVFVETALVLPVLFLVLGGLVNFGTTLISLGDVLGAARAGAHVAAYYKPDPNSIQKNEEIYKITRASVEEYLSSAGHDSSSFLVNVRTVLYPMPNNTLKHPNKDIVQEAIRVSVKQTGVSSFLSKLFRTSPCGSAVFVRGQDPDFLPEDQNNPTATLDDINEGDDFSC